MNAPIAVFEYQVIIKPSDIDLNGHVNNVSYITWMQNAAIAHSAANGLDMEAYFAMQCSWVVGSHSIDYFRPLFLDDKVIVKTYVDHYGKKEAFRKFEFVKEGRIVAKAETKWVFVDMKSGRPIRIPQEVQKRFVQMNRENLLS